MSVSIAQDLHFCLDVLGLDDNQTDELLNTCENMGEIGVEYFCEEFIFGARDTDEGVYSTEDIIKYHDENYLNIAEFNSLFWRSH